MPDKSIDQQLQEQIALVSYHLGQVHGLIEKHKPVVSDDLVARLMQVAYPSVVKHVLLTSPDILNNLKVLGIVEIVASVRAGVWRVHAYVPGPDGANITAEPGEHMDFLHASIEACLNVLESPDWLKNFVEGQD